MSIVLSSAARLKPEIRLADAVSQFKKDLSSQQKITYHTYDSQSRGSPPDLIDVRRLTADIDRRACGMTVGRRCFGPRLTNFLQAVQQYAALGDVVVGGSQNTIACGVWSVVRMSLLTIVNFSSYFERLSSLLMIIGRSAPRYQKMALIYPRSQDLQSHLAEYFIVVIRLCHQSLKFTQKSSLEQFASTLSDSDIRTYQSELGQWANSIKEEVSLLSTQKIEQEAQENSLSRALLGRFSQSISHQQMLATNLRVRRACPRYDYETTYKQTRKRGNTTLFTQLAEYQDWKRQAGPCTLVLTGKLGSGKSVVLANIVDDLNLHGLSQNVTVAFFFCRHDISESLKMRTIIGSLAEQLLRPIPDLSTQRELVDGTTAAFDADRIFQLLHQALPPSYKAYFVLDGLDEMCNLERASLIYELQRLQETFALHLCISRQINPTNASNWRLEALVSTSSTPIPDNRPDIEACIEGELENRIKSGKLELEDPRLVLEIRDALLEGSQGMFLWVALQMESMCSMPSDDAIRHALANLPEGLPETFSRILLRSEDSGKPYQRRILELVIAARRPLTAEALREALSVVPGDPVWNPARLLNNVFSTLVCCGSILIIDEEELTVRLVHHSVKKFLLRGAHHSAAVAFTQDSAERTMADIVITYLNYGVFETQLSTMVVPQIPAGSIPTQIMSSILGPRSSVRSRALTLFKSTRSVDHAISKTLADTGKFFGPRSANDFHFSSYAGSYWQEHVWLNSPADPVIYELLQRLFQRKILTPSSWADHARLSLLLAATEGNKALVNVLLDWGNVDANSTDEENRTPLLLAAMNGHEAVVKVLLDSGNVDADAKDEYKQTPLLWAARGGHAAVIKVLLDSGRVDADAKDISMRTPLWWAAKKGHAAIAKVLLDSSRVDADAKDMSRRTPLSWAAEKGHAAVIKVLLDSGRVDADAEDMYGRTPLSWAAENGYETVVKMLREHKGRDNIVAPDSGRGVQER